MSDTAALFFEDANGNAWFYIPDSNSNPADGEFVEIGDTLASFDSGNLASSTSYGGAGAVSFNGYVLFDGGSGSGSGGANQLVIDNHSQHSYVTVDPSNAALWFDPHDFTVNYNSTEVYFEGANASGETTLWVTNGTSGGTHEVTVGGNPVIANGPMANLGSNLFLNGNANGGSSADLVELTSGGALKTIAAGANPIDMISTTVGVQGSKTAVNDLFFNGYGANSSSDNQTSQSGHLYVSNGSSVSELGGSSVKNPVDLTSLTFTNLKGQQQTDVFFNGTDNNGNQGLYMVTANGSGGVTNPTKIAFQTGNGAGAADLDPQSLAVANGKLYFVGNETGQYTGTLDGPDTSPEGLWVYDPNSGGASNQNGGGEAQLVSAKIDGSGSPVTIGQSNYDLNASMNPGSQNTINPQAELASVGGNLYFNADHGGTNGGLFVYDPSNGTIYNHLGNSQGSTPYNLAAVSVS